MFVFGLTGCIGEDLIDCPVAENVELSFLYYGDGDEDIFPQKVARVTTYIFDDSYSSIRRYEAGKNELNTHQGIRLQLPEGTYHAVCWGNVWRAGEQFHSKELQELTDYLLVHGEDGKEVTGMDSLYYGKTSFRVDGKGNVSKVIPFVSAHINMEIYMKGWKHLFADEGEVPEVVLTGLFTQYDFAMALSGDPDIVKPVMQRKDNDILATRFCLLRFPDENPIEIHVRQKAGNTLYTLGLQAFMESNQIKVEGIQEITIPIYLSFGSHGVEVGIDPWDSIPVTPDL